MTTFCYDTLKIPVRSRGECAKPNHRLGYYSARYLTLLKRDNVILIGPCDWDSAGRISGFLACSFLTHEFSNFSEFL